MGWVVGLGSRGGTAILGPSTAPVAGSQSIGTTAYAVPSGAIFATAAGGSGGSGTIGAPYQSAQAAINAASANATIVLRGGSYNESITTPAGKPLTIQAYPNEAVWFDAAGAASHALVTSDKITFLGIGVRNYTGGGSSDYLGAYAMGFLGGSVGGSLFENCVFDSSGLDGLKVGTTDCVLRWCTFRNSQRTGFQATQCDRIHIDRCVIINNNKGNYAPEPETSGIKITRCDQPLITQSWVEDIPGAYGIWFDVFCTRINVVSNVINAGAHSLNHCIELELADGGNFAGVQNYSYVVGNDLNGATYAGVKLVDTGYTVVANNDMRTCSIGMWLQQDNREHGSTDYRTPTECPAHCLANPLMSNIYDGGTGFTAYDAGGLKNYTGGQMLGRVSGNWSAGSQMGSLGAVGGSRSTGTYVNPSNLATVDSAHGGPLNLGTNYRGSVRPADSITDPMSATLAALLGRTTGAQLLGPAIDALPTLRLAA